MTGLWVLVGVLIAGTAVGVLQRTRRGRLSAPKASGSVITSEQIGTPLGPRATLLQFSSAFCAPCRATRRILGDVAEAVDGVRHVEIDAESHLDLVRLLDVRSTPTTFVLDARGAIVRRASGQPRKADVLAALGEAVPG